MHKTFYLGLFLYLLNWFNTFWEIVKMIEVFNAFPLNLYDCKCDLTQQFN